MKRSAWLFSVAAGVVLLLGGCGGANLDGGNGAGQGDNGDGVVTQSLTDDLQFLREEEKLARDVYRTLYDKWQLAPHKNIASSEQTHTDRVASTMETLGIEDPVDDDTVGVFVNDDLAKLYTDLVAAGEKSEVDALSVGATVEDLDIRDIEDMKARTSNTSALSMYDALQCGSRNHLRAYTSQLAARDASYAPQYLSRAQFDAIVGSDHEKCGP